MSNDERHESRNGAEDLKEAQRQISLAHDMLKSCVDAPFTPKERDDCMGHLHTAFHLIQNAPRSESEERCRGCGIKKRLLNGPCSAECQLNVPDAPVSATEDSDPLQAEVANITKRLLNGWQALYALGEGQDEPPHRMEVQIMREAKLLIEDLYGMVCRARSSSAPSSEVEQLHVQLAGCSTAALGWNKEPAREGDYGWSRAYQDVLELRAKYERLQTDFAARSASEEIDLGTMPQEKLLELRFDVEQELVARGTINAADRQGQKP